MNKRWIKAVLLCWGATGCGGGEPQVVCDTGTRLEADRCVPEVQCGSDTEVVDGRCVPSADPIACGPDTVQKDGECVLASEPVECGEGTVLVDGQCVVEEPLECGPKTVARNGACIPLHDQPVFLPFAEGHEVKFSQTFHGFFSHKDKSVYAVDFPADIGTPIHAVRGGIVRQIKEDSSTGCADPMCASQGNFVRVDHGDGTIGIYFHLDFEGALVEPGDQVARGQAIGKSGNTGFSSGPHLHLAVVDFYGQSQPLKFAELMNISEGVPFKGAEVLSQNALQPMPDEPYEPSACETSTFAHVGVLLSDPFPCSIASKDKDYIIKGTATQAKKVKIAQKAPGEGEWIYTCIDVDDTGAFEHAVSWPAAAFEADSFFMVTGAKNTPSCPSVQGWSSSPRLSLW